MNEQEFRTNQPAEGAIPGIDAKVPPLNLAHTTDHELLLQFAEPTPPDILIMIDIESLALGARPVITQVAMLGYDLQEDEYLSTQHVQYYPIDPQLQLIPPRRVTASTIAWWMSQDTDARERFELSTSTDFQDLVALCRGLVSTFNQLTKNGTLNYEISAKHPQFDVVAIETLLEEVGLEKPWRHDRVFDVATDLKRAGINYKNVPKPSGFVEHVAYYDAKWQISMYLEAKKRLAK